MENYFDYITEENGIRYGVEFADGPTLKLYIIDEYNKVLASAARTDNWNIFYELGWTKKELHAQRKANWYGCAVESEIDRYYFKQILPGEDYEPELFSLDFCRDAAKSYGEETIFGFAEINEDTWQAMEVDFDGYVKNRGEIYDSLEKATNDELAFSF